jgi:hypothetical protein
MKLFVHNYYDVDTRTTTDPNKEPLVWAETAPDIDYNECQDISIVEKFEETANDYKVSRDFIKSLVLSLDPDESTAFDLLSEQEKVIAAKHKIGTEQQRQAVLGYANHLAAMALYRYNTILVRQQRALIADTLLQNELPNDKIAVMSVANDPLKLYTDYGIEGIDSGDSVPGISDYINSINGYETVGLSVQTYTPLNGTLNTLCNSLINILINGIY